ACGGGAGYRPRVRCVYSTTPFIAIAARRQHSEYRGSVSRFEGLECKAARKYPDRFETRNTEDCAKGGCAQGLRAPQGQAFRSELPSVPSPRPRRWREICAWPETNARSA